MGGKRRYVNMGSPSRPSAVWLACRSVRHHAPAMFIVSEEAATAIRTAYGQEGEMSAAIEVRRLFLALPTTPRRGSAPGP